MEILILMMLAHFVGDYPFQTNWIITQKFKSLPGGLYHIVALTLSYVIFLAPYLYSPYIWISIAILMILHYAQDSGKMLASKHIPKLLGYYFDQIFHIATIYLLWVYLLDSGQNLSPLFGADLYTNTTLSIYLLGLTLFTYVLDVTLFIHRKDLILKRNFTLMAKSAIIYTLLFYIVSNAF